MDTKVFNQAVKRNIERFPAEFRFQLTQEEYDSLRSQIVTSKKGEAEGDICHMSLRSRE
ncbi:MAG: ORF6N domain-containing protein [Erysipelotrichaceae bacterium]|nr:ORF6N domain-containing protein [Erysipelotrichaceae bacterium]